MNSFTVFSIAALVIVQSVIGAPTATADKCSAVGNTFSIVPGTNCEKFFQSSAQVTPSVKSCNPGLRFDLKVCNCNWANLVPCADAGVTQSVAPEASTPQPTTPKPATTRTAVPDSNDSPTTPSATDKCVVVGNTFSIVPGTNCEKFFQSSAQVAPTRKSCNPGLRFDLKVCNCNWASLVPCSDSN